MGVEADENASGERLVEGADFTSAEELGGLIGDENARIVTRGVAERLAEAVEQEVRWLRLTGDTPGGPPWDRQPAWRVRLWEHLIEEQDRARAIERVMTAW